MICVSTCTKYKRLKTKQQIPFVEQLQGIKIKMATIDDLQEMKLFELAEQLLLDDESFENWLVELGLLQNPSFLQPLEPDRSVVSLSQVHRRSGATFQATQP
jgi:hypothetical protein